MPRTLVASLATLCLAAAPASAAVDFAKQILPLLQRACFECHGPDVQKANLRLDAKSHAFTSGTHAPVITPGNPDTSELLRRVALPRSNKESMPRRGTPLTPAEWTLTNLPRAAIITTGQQQPPHPPEAKPQPAAQSQPPRIQLGLPRGPLG
jgi:hypothetical protein